MAGAKPPWSLWVAIAAALVTVAGFVMLFFGLVAFFNATFTALVLPELSVDFLIRGVLALALGIVLIIAGRGLFKREMLGWNLAFLVGLIALGYFIYQAAWGSGLTLIVGIGIGVEVGAVVYLIFVRKFLRPARVVPT